PCARRSTQTSKRQVCARKHTFSRPLCDPAWLNGLGKQMLSRKFIVAFDKLPNVFFGVLPQLRAIKMFKVIFNDRNVLIVHHEVCIRRSPHEARFCDGMILYLFRYFGTCERIDIVDGQVGLSDDYEESLIRLLIRFRYVSNVEQYGVTIAPGAEHGS